ncbi:MAG: FHA domain-containing protein [Clostridium sp.]|jgi:hypothetical protein|nr:FHA domain-containing protein [Clostridium sp.]
MDHGYLERFEFDYESDASGSFLIVNADADEKVLTYQIEMIKNNPNKNILPVSLIQKDSKYQFRYSITSSLALSQYLKRNKLKRDEFIDIFYDITKTILDSKSYLLSDKAFIINKEYIYINPDSMEVALVYLPLNFDININEILKNFTINFIMYGSNIEESSNDNFIQRILYLLKSDTFNILELNNLLRELKAKRETAQMDVHQHSDKNLPDVENPSPNILEPKAFIQGSETTKSSVKRPENKKPVTAKPEATKPKTCRPQIPKPQIPKPKVPKPQIPGSRMPKPRTNALIPNTKNDNTASRPREIKMRYKTSVIVLGGILQGIMLFCSILLLTSGVMDSLENDMAINIIGVGMLVGAASYLVWKTLLVEKNKVENISTIKKSSAVAKQQLDGQKKEPVFVPDRKNSPLAEGIKPERGREQSLAVNLFKAADRTVIIQPKDYNKTMFLSSKEKAYPYLEGKNSSAREKIIINRSNFIIGRLPGKADYISKNNAVGKVHAEIISRDGCYFVKDLNSLNGTFINAKRLTSNMEYEIKNNDIITFANSEYVFIIPDV